MASMIGLVVLVIAHLAGTVHAATPAGSHLDVTITACSHEVQQPLHHAAAPHPAHHHPTGDGHVDHLADRPRVTGPDGPVAPGPDALPLTLLPPAVTLGLSHLGRDPVDRPRAPHSAAARSLLCVWRQ
jgi:hypothetical protein